jgi:nicotinate (nicotinamide) nucleotide adenylyltransferase/ribosome silencing factor RsfS/YbeB/iojap
VETARCAPDPYLLSPVPRIPRIKFGAGVGIGTSCCNAAMAGSNRNGGVGEGMGIGMRRHRRIGLMGGSFNPAHGGHLHLSLAALRHLALDEVWWMVSPQNPLKPAAGMAPFAVRLRQAERIAMGHKRIRVTDIEDRLGASYYTADTLKRLARRFPHQRFVWLMGCDNLEQLPRWARWTEIFRTVPVAVFDRPSYAHRALAGIAAQRFARRRISERAARRLAEAKPPAWVFFHSRLDPTSATQIRSERDITPTPPQREYKPELATITALPSRARLHGSPATEPRALLDLVLKTLDDAKADDIVTIDLAGKTTIADYMVIATGRSARQVAALTEHLEAALARRIKIWIEGKEQADWVLIDASDVIVHLFRPEIRAYYNLEKMWGAAFPDAELARQ